MTLSELRKHLNRCMKNPNRKKKRDNLSVDATPKTRREYSCFVKFEGHTGIAIGEKLVDCLEDWCLKDIFGVTLTMPANTVAMDHLKQVVTRWTRSPIRAKYLHVRCSAHVLALVIKYAVRLFNESVKRIRSVVKYVLGSPSRYEKFKQCASLAKVDYKKALNLDVYTRWNITYLMLEDAQRYEKVFAMLAQIDKDFQERFIFEQDKDSVLPSDADIEEAIASDDILEEVVEDTEEDEEVFFDATVNFSASTQVTTHSFLWELVFIHEQLIEFRENVASDPFIARMSRLMFAKYNKYWGVYEKMNPVMFFAQLLDPREKLKGLEFTLNCLFENNLWEVQRIMRKVKLEFQELFDDYSSVYSTHEEGSSSVASANANRIGLEIASAGFATIIFVCNDHISFLVDLP
ncbi:zinc finger BED domain-containing protein RICESLEEPER 2-like [Papaver somniferum]|uniref:zinc finger BED domain-containing protein RICESLEEPER 2-like n=1 Tax=Papaver somniferum TaxID=3469 RepID=UPI000E6FA932|nr:zinc finger BED domain-containing protein RICESLEEPER 2-like [Papaver somniferum]